MSSNLIPQDRVITNRDGLTTPSVYNKTTCLALLKGMLTKHNYPAIHYLYNEEPAVGGQIKHNYKFFVLVKNRIFNVSGVISMIFGVTVQDRSQAFSINTLTKTDDVKAFTKALREHTELDNLFIEDLLQTAEQPMEYTISSAVTEFLEPVDSSNHD